MASLTFNNYLDDVWKGNILATDTFKVMLTTDAYTPDQDAHTKRSNVSNEVSGAGYAAGGQVIVPVLTKNTTLNRMEFVFPQIVWPSSTITARRAVYYKSRGGASSADELVCVDDFGADVSSTDGTFTLHATSIFIPAPAP